MSDNSNLSDFLFIHSKPLPFIYTNLIGFLVLAFKEMIGFEPSIQPSFFFFYLNLFYYSSIFIMGFAITL